MPVVTEFDLYPGDRGADLRDVITRAESACPSGVTWRIRVHEGPLHSHTKVTLEGPVLSQIWTPWVGEQDGEYSRTVRREGTEWQHDLEHSLRNILARSS